ncbi:MAG: Flp pilus assembly protein CpaB [Rhodovibrionaceae bacterium]
MTARKLILIVVALVIVAGTVQFIRVFLNQQQPSQQQVTEAPPPEPKYQVLVAAEDLPTGSLVRPGQLRWRAWPEDQWNDGAYIEMKSNDIEAFTGAVVRQGLRAGEPITPGRMVRPGERGFLAAVLNPNMRAISVPINAITGIAGFVFPGDRVDLILTHEISRPEDPVMPTRRASETVLTGVRILAIDQTASDQQDKPKVGQIATLELLPKEAELVILLVELGQLSLSLRSLADEPEEAIIARRQDAAEQALTRVDQQRLIRDDPERGFTWDSEVSMLLPSPTQSNRTNRSRVQVLRGGESIELSF